MKAGDEVDFAVLKAAVETLAEELGKINHRLERLEHLNEDSVLIRRLSVYLAAVVDSVRLHLTERAAKT